VQLRRGISRLNSRARANDRCSVRSRAARISLRQDHFSCCATASTELRWRRTSTELMTRLSVRRGFSSAVRMTRVSRATVLASGTLLSTLLPSMILPSIFSKSSSSAAATLPEARRARVRRSPMVTILRREIRTRRGNFYIGGNPWRQRNFHQIKRVELPGQGTDTWRGVCGWLTNAIFTLRLLSALTFLASRSMTSGSKSARLRKREPSPQ